MVLVWSVLPVWGFPESDVHPAANIITSTRTGIILKKTFFIFFNPQ